MISKKSIAISEKNRGPGAPVSSNSTELTFFPPLILVGLLLLVVVTGGNKVNSFGVSPYFYIKAKIVIFTYFF